MQLVNTYRLYVPFTQALVWTTGTYRLEVPSCEHLAITNKLTVEYINRRCYIQYWQFKTVHSVLA